MRGGAGGSGLQGPLEGEEAAFRLGGGSPGSLVMPVAMVGGGDSPRDCSQREGLNRVFHWMVGSLKVGMGVFCVHFYIPNRRGLGPREVLGVVLCDRIIARTL